MKRLLGLLTLVLILMLAVAACGDDDEPTPTPAAAAAEQPAAFGNAENGKALFASTCAVCHGPEGKGVQGLGKDMTTSTFIAGLSDDEMLAFVKTGRPISDPLNTTKVDMPPKGGNPALTDEQLKDIIAFIRTIHVQ